MATAAELRRLRDLKARDPPVLSTPLQSIFRSFFIHMFARLHKRPRFTAVVGMHNVLRDVYRYVWCISQSSAGGRFATASSECGGAVIIF